MQMCVCVSWSALIYLHVRLKWRAFNTIHFTNNKFKCRACARVCECMCEWLLCDTHSEINNNNDDDDDDGKNAIN